jgi:hypothetical protein
MTGVSGVAGELTPVNAGYAAERAALLALTDNRHNHAG